jgi:hypothetical protein
MTCCKQRILMKWLFLIFVNEIYRCFGNLNWYIPYTNMDGEFQKGIKTKQVFFVFLFFFFKFKDGIHEIYQ